MLMNRTRFIITALVMLLTTTARAQETLLFRLSNANGMEAWISNMNGRVVSLTAPNWNGRMENVIYDHDANAQKKMLEVESHDNNRITLQNQDVTITYTLTDQNALDVDILNKGQNSSVGNIMFNIAGEPSRNILAQHLWVDCKHYKKARQLSAYAKDLNKKVEKLNDGFARTFQLMHPGNSRKPAVIIYDTQSGRAMTVYTTAPALRLYSYTNLNGIGFAPQASATHTKLVFKFTTDPPILGNGM